MTRKEFSSKSKAIRRIEGRYYFALMGLVLTVVLVRAFAPFYLRDHPDAHRLEMAGRIFFTIAAIGGLSGMAWIPYHFARKSGLACPTCGKALINREAWVALLTGNCGKCGNKVFSDGVRDSASAAKKGWITAEQFKLRIENLNRKFSRRVVILTTAGFALAVVCAPVCFYLSLLFDKGQLDSWLTPPVLRCAVAAMLGAAVLLYLSLLILGTTKKHKHPGIPCPECGRSIFGRAAQAALEGNICIYCSAQLFEAPVAKKA